MSFTTREEWLHAFAEAASPVFENCDMRIPDIRISIGFPSRGVRSNSIGECWSAECSEDGHFEIFVHPRLAGDSDRVADVLTHELIHAAIGLEEKHGPRFKRAAYALGLTGPAKATVAGPEWHGWADPILREMGPIPGAELKLLQTTAPPKQTTRMLKLICDCCAFTCRTTAKHIEMHEGLRCAVPDCDGALQRQDAA